MLNAAYLELLRRYHGHDQGVCRVDETYAVEWAYVPHFHYNYYVYAYATSFIAAAAFSDNILTGANGGAAAFVDSVLKVEGSSSMISTRAIITLTAAAARRDDMDRPTSPDFS